MYVMYKINNKNIYLFYRFEYLFSDNFIPRGSCILFYYFLCNLLYCAHTVTSGVIM